MTKTKRRKFCLETLIRIIHKTNIDILVFIEHQEIKYALKEIVVSLKHLHSKHCISFSWNPLPSAIDQIIYTYFIVCLYNIQSNYAKWKFIWIHLLRSWCVLSRIFLQIFFLFNVWYDVYLCQIFCYWF